jgi:peptidoglycan/LPS O-acetylase OafA/YrhL
MSVSLPVPRSDAIAFRRFFDIELLDNRYPALHGMRVLAIASIVQNDVTMFLTLRARVPVDPQWAGTSLAIFFAMDLFFVQSGFLLGSQLIRSIESSGVQHIRSFYLRRALRTIPPFYLAVTFLAAVQSLTSAQWRHLGLEYAFLSNYRFPLDSGDLVAPWGWSLALVEQFYLAVPIVLFLLYKLPTHRARLFALGILFIAALFVRLALVLRHRNWSEHQLYDFVYYRTHARFDTFVAGLALAYVQHRWSEPIAHWLQSPRARAAVALPALGCLWLLMHPGMFGWGGVRLMHVFSWGTLTSAMYAAWMLLVLNDPQGWIQRGLSARIFRTGASLGFGVFLTYAPLCGHVVGPLARALVRGRAWPIVVVWPLAVTTLLVASFFAAYLLHVAVEKPLARFRRGL